MKRLLVLLAIITVLLASCEQSEGPEIIQDMDRSGKPYAVRVYTYDNERDVTDAYRLFVESKGQTFDGNTRLGWSGWNVSDNVFVCHIHVIRIRKVRDKQLETWGHELAHCIYGNYHKLGLDL